MNTFQQLRRRLSFTFLAVSLSIGLLTYAGWTLASSADEPTPAALSVAASSSSSSGSLALWRTPSSVDDITERATAVVVGSYVEVVGVVYDDVEPEGVERGWTQGYPTTVMRFVVDEYIVGAGPREILIGQRGDFPQGIEGDHAPPEFNTEVTLAVLRSDKNPRMMVVFWGPWGSFTERNGSVEHAFVLESRDSAPPAPPAFAEGMSLKDLHDALRDSAQERSMEVAGR